MKSSVVLFKCVWFQYTMIGLFLLWSDIYRLYLRWCFSIGFHLFRIRMLNNTYRIREPVRHL